MRKSQRILAVVNDRHLYKKLAELLDRSSFEVNRIPSGAGALILVGNLRYDLILLEEPLPDLGLQDFVTAIRTLDSPCANSSLLVLTRDVETVDLSENQLAEDLAVISTEAEVRELQAQVSNLLGVAARSAARIVVELHARLGEGAFKRMGQTANISETGMLVSGSFDIPLGSEVELEFELPDDSRPMALKGEVVRHASPEVENLTGIGIRFTQVNADAAERLRDFVRARLASPQLDESDDGTLDLDDVAPTASG